MATVTGTVYGDWIYDTTYMHWRPCLSVDISNETPTATTLRIDGKIETGYYYVNSDNGEDKTLQGILLYRVDNGEWITYETRDIPYNNSIGIRDFITLTINFPKITQTKAIEIKLVIQGIKSGDFYWDSVINTPEQSTAIFTTSIDPLKSYTITYNGNATNATKIPVSQTKYYGESINLSTQIPVRTGYNFIGWALSQTATTPKYRAGINYTYSDNANLTLYAVWSQIIYTISYNENGGTWEGDTPEVQIKEYNQSIILSSIEPIRLGYTFVNWNTESDGSGTNYRAGGTYSRNTNATMYAQWMVKTYNITYNANGGTNAPSAGVKYYNEPYTLSNDIPTRTNYVFIGWGINSSDIVPTYKVGETNIYTENNSITLYAIWVSSTYTITYNRNNGNWTGPSTQTKNYNESLTLTSIEPTLDGYSFAGWGTNPDGTGSNYIAGGTYTKNEDVTLYALWRYTVTYNANGGTGTMSSSSALLGTPLQLKGNTFIKNQYDFDGWATSVEGAKIYDNQALFVGRNTTLYAHWVEKPKGWINKIRLLTGPVGNRTTNDFVIGTTFDQVQYSESNGATLLDLANSLKTFFGSRMFMFYKGKEPMNRNVMQWYQVVAATENPTSTETTIANS